MAPGTLLREGLENVLRARTGGLIVIGDGPSVMAMVNGGFRIDSEFLPSSLYELAKMDGAIILSHDVRRILYANAQLVPNPAIPSLETGIRHRTAERVAKETGEVVIAISQRRHVITVYQGQIRYILRDPNVILSRANQALQTLERYRSILTQALLNLGALEFEDLVTVSDVATVLQRTEVVMRIAAEIDRYVIELGVEGRLISMQMAELMNAVEDEGNLVLRDYAADPSPGRATEIRRQLASWSNDDLLDLSAVARLLGGNPAGALDLSVVPRGYRILKKIPRLPMPVIENLVASFETLPRLLEASLEELDAVEGIGEVRARSIREGLRRLKDQMILDRHL